MIIDDVHRGIHKRRKRKRIGRGTGSGRGKTSGRGHKGYGSRSGATRRLGFEGGQMPLTRRMAKRGFNNRQFAANVATINIGALDRAFDAGATVTPEALAEKGLVKGRYDVLKVLGDGTLAKKLTVRAHRFSGTAERKITEQGGTVERILPSS